MIQCSRAFLTQPWRTRIFLRFQILGTSFCDVSVACMFSSSVLIQYFDVFGLPFV